MPFLRQPFCKNASKPTPAKLRNCATTSDNSLWHVNITKLGHGSAEAAHLQDHQTCKFSRCLAEAGQIMQAYDVSGGQAGPAGVAAAVKRLLNSTATVPLSLVGHMEGAEEPKELAGASISLQVKQEMRHL